MYAAWEISNLTVSKLNLGFEKISLGLETVSLSMHFLPGTFFSAQQIGSRACVGLTRNQKYGKKWH